MISEHNFAGGFSSFWRTTLPNLEAVVRALNGSPRRIDRPIESPNQPVRRDIIAECGFRLFAFRIVQGRPVHELISIAFEKAANALNERSAEGRRWPDNLNSLETEEVLRIAHRLESFCQKELDETSLVVDPAFRGHGIIHECRGDMADNRRLVEVKYVNRNFRSIDYRQCLIYEGLQYLSSEKTHDNIAIYNPYMGIMCDVRLEELVYGAGGRAFVEFAWELSYALTAGELSR